MHARQDELVDVIHPTVLRVESSLVTCFSDSHNSNWVFPVVHCWINF